MSKVHSSNWIVLCFVTLINLPIVVLAQSCYRPPIVGQNGTAQESHVTCNINQDVSMCCRPQASGDSPADVCLQNGLCMNNQSNIITYWRKSCTDPTWQSPYCVVVECGLDGNGNAEMTPCAGSNTNYCCGHNNTACCGTPSMIVLAAVDRPVTTSTSTSSTTIPTSSASNSLSPKATSSTGLSTGAKAGIGAGVGAVALIGILGIGFWCISRKSRSRKRGRSVHEKDAMIEKPVELQDGDYTSKGDMATKPVELHPYVRPAEMAS